MGQVVKNLLEYSAMIERILPYSQNDIGIHPYNPTLITQPLTKKKNWQTAYETDLVRWAEKQVRKAVKNRLWLSEASFDDFSLSHASFSSKAGAVLTFFAYFFASRQKE